MRSIRTMGLALVAVFLLGAVTASGASATQPEAEPEGGTFPVTFTGTGGAGTLETLDGAHTVKCTGQSSTGEITSKTQSKATLKFTGCSSSGATCTTAGEPSGTVTSKVVGELVYTGASKNIAAVWFKPASGSTFASFSCTLFGIGTSVTVTEGVVCPVEPVNTSTSTLKIVCKQTKGMNEFMSYWSPSTCAEVADFLKSAGTAINGGPSWANQGAGIEGTQTLTLSKKVTIKSSMC